MEQDWEMSAKSILKAELKRKDVTYQQLAEKLSTIGLEESSENIANKISRGKFSAIFFLQCLQVIGVKTLRLGD